MVLGVISLTHAQDSIRVIDEVTVKGRLLHHETIEPQTLRASDIQKVSAHTVADAIRWMSGVQLKDYGGIGGLKTVNLRSMGSQHIGIYYDGIELGNAQNGVIDLGQYSLDNIEEISLYDGQRSALLQTASDFANAGSIYIRTLLPHFGEETTRIKAQYGSSHTARLSALLSRTLAQHIAWNANVEALSSSGKYPFTYQRRNYDGSLAYDTTATRRNGDIQSIRAESNLYGTLTNGTWQAKLYTFHANRGIPGAIVNNVWRRGERQSDHNTFAQASWQRDFAHIYTLRIQGKYAYYHTHYQNRDTTTLQIDNTYRQHEAYANITQAVALHPHSSLSLSYDLRWNHLDADLPQFSHPTRWSHLLSLANAWDLDRLQFQASGVMSQFTDHAAGHREKVSRCFIPAFFASYKLRDGLRLTGYAKRSYRMPTFNDLYYTEFGNAMLKPERATQYAVGIKTKGKVGQRLDAQFDIDLYHNRITDKIVAYPKGQQFRWTMLNLGIVDITGLELRLNTACQLDDQWRLSAMMQYTYQQACDVTDRAASYYKDQIPYTPWHSGSATAMLDYKAWTLAYNFVYTGERYCQMENIRYNHLEPWYTSDLTLSGQIGLWRLGVEVRNLFDQQYDVIINYPMPGRNYNLSVQCEF